MINEFSKSRVNPEIIIMYFILEFIKKGCISSTIDIEISNVGPFPYKKDIFGKSIVISRQFKATGGSQYKIKSDTGTAIYFLINFKE